MMSGIFPSRKGLWQLKVNLIDCDYIVDIILFIFIVNCDDQRVHGDTFHLGQVHSTAGVLPMSEFRPKYRDRLSFSSLSASTDAKLIEAGLAVTNLSSSLTDLRPGLLKQAESEKSQTTLSVGRQRPGERGEEGGREGELIVITLLFRF